MATGCTPAVPLAHQPAIAAPLNALDYPYDPTETGNLSLSSACGSRASAQPVSMPGDARGGCQPRAFFDDWYHRVHVLPGRIDLGNLIQPEDRSVEVWNAHFTGQLAAGRTETGTTGIAIDEPVALPYTWQPLQSVTYTVSIDTVGPSEISARFQWTFPAELPGVDITGTRVVLFPFRANARADWVEGLEWLTGLRRAADLSEQRAKLRDVPRRALELLYTLHGVELQRADALLAGWQSRVYALPLWTDPGYLDAPAAAADLRLELDTTYLDFHAERIAILWAGSDQTEIVALEAVDPTGLDLSRALVGDWPAGTLVLPGYLARLDPRQGLGRLAGQLGEQVLRWAIQDNVAWTPDDGADTYRGQPLLLLPPNWRQPPPRDYLRHATFLDNRTGPAPTVKDPSDRPTVLEAWLRTAIGRAEIHALRGWLAARAGKQKGFWAPTDADDLTLAAPAVASDQAIDVAHTDYTKLLLGRPGRRDIQILLHDGTRLHRRITGASAIDSNTERLTLDAGLGVDIALADLHRISWLQWWRLNADRLELTWKGDVVELTVPVWGLANEQ